MSTTRLQVRATEVTDDNPLPVTSAPAPSGAAAVVATFGSGSKTVAATGTPEVLVASATLVDTVIISPLRANTGVAYVGLASGNDTQALEAPVVLTAPPGKKINLNLIYIDVAVAGEGVRYDTID